MPYAKNARQHSDAQIAQIAGSIKAFKFRSPIVVTSDGGIVCGHGRVLAARKLGMDEVPCVYADDLSENERRAYILADNKIAENATWDQEMLNIELDDLFAQGFDLQIAGFTQEEILHEGSGGGTEGLTDPDEVPEPPKTPVSKRGDIWLLGEHRVMCGDSTSESDVERLMVGMKADMCFTSPPYNAGVSAKLRGNTSIDDNFYQGEYDDNQSSDDYFHFLKDATNNAIKHSRYIFWNIQFLAGNRKVIPEWWYVFSKRIVDVAIWDKGHAAPQQAQRVLNSVFEFIFILTSDVNPCRAIRIAPEFRGCIDNIFRLSPQRQNEFAAIHAATFPVAFPEEFISKFAPVSGAVLELFCGTGTTLIACEKTGRRCFGMEISEAYCDVIVARWEAFTGKKATLE